MTERQAGIRLGCALCALIGLDPNQIESLDVEFHLAAGQAPTIEIHHVGLGLRETCIEEAEAALGLFRLQAVDQ